MVGVLQVVYIVQFKKPIDTSGYANISKKQVLVEEILKLQDKGVMERVANARVSYYSQLLLQPKPSFRGLEANSRSEQGHKVP